MYLFQMSGNVFSCHRPVELALFPRSKIWFANFPTITGESVSVAEETERYVSERARNVHCGNVK